MKRRVSILLNAGLDDVGIACRLRISLQRARAEINEILARIPPPRASADHPAPALPPIALPDGPQSCPSESGVGGQAGHPGELRELGVDRQSAVAPTPTREVEQHREAPGGENGGRATGPMAAMRPGEYADGSPANAITPSPAGGVSGIAPDKGRQSDDPAQKTASGGGGDIAPHLLPSRRRAVPRRPARPKPQETAEERRLIDAAVAEGRVKRLPTMHAWGSIQTGLERELY